MRPVPLGDVVDIIMGQAPPSKACNFDGIGTPFVKVGEFGPLRPVLREWTTAPLKLARKTDVLLCVVGATCGKINLGEDCAIGRSVAAIRPKPEVIDQLYLYHFLSTLILILRSGSQGAAQTVISKEMIQSIDIPLPPLPEQRRIVAILDEVFAGLATATANAGKNLKNARELFDSYLELIFTRTGRAWINRKISDVAALTRGHNPPKSKFSNVPKDGYVRFYQIRDGKTDDYAVYVPDTPQLHRVEPDDILMVAYRHIGRAFRGANGAFNVALCKIVNRDRSLLNDDFLYYIIPTSLVRGELLKQAERSLIPSMSVEHLKEIKIPVPPIAEQKIVVSEIHRLEKAIEHLEVNYQQKLTALTELKQIVLQKAFCGELTSPPSQAIEEAAE
jgi:type I restriction enzyme S subunit